MKVHPYARNMNLNRKKDAETENFDVFLENKTMNLFFLIPKAF